MCSVLPLRFWLLLVVILAVGCTRQKALNIEKTLSIDPGSVKTVIYDAPIEDQQVTIAVNSPEPVDVFLVLEDNLQKATDAAVGGAQPENPLASKTKTKEATLEAKIPAKKGFAVLVNNPINNKKTDAKVKATSK
jgi:hypothetical protein